MTTRMLQTLPSNAKIKTRFAFHGNYGGQSHLHKSENAGRTTIKFSSAEVLLLNDQLVLFHQNYGRKVSAIEAAN